MSHRRSTRAIGAARPRSRAREKVTGAARYAYEHPSRASPTPSPVQATIARGRCAAIDARAALALPGVLAVLCARERRRGWPTSTTPSWRVLQSPEVAYRGQIVARRRRRDARDRPRGRRGSCASPTTREPHDVVLRADHPRPVHARAASTPATRPTPSRATSRRRCAAAAVTVDATYTTPAEHNNPMEPHATIAALGRTATLTLYDSNQGASDGARHDRRRVRPRARAACA